MDCVSVADDNCIASMSYLLPDLLVAYGDNYGQYTVGLPECKCDVTAPKFRVGSSYGAL